MALTIDDLKVHCNLTGTDDDAVLTRLLAAATSHIEGQLGFTLASMEGGAPDDLEHAVYMLAADFYESREASVVGMSAHPVPFGVMQIVNEHRNYTFAAEDE